ncbi:MAG: tRNA pseudouridine(54/55) synthase Pus10 [Candidatus Korarchaeum sp.]|nr:tRNA pseudouridine(54/55) synthase Pus10 [Candidatus Korarchaeum sp.]MDW8034951.1 tRNA pseudouridine(54/55) synthase Pus10 [Candidatus Korarchaeum sp.]
MGDPIDFIITKEGALCEFCENSLRGGRLEELVSIIKELLKPDELRVKQECSLCGSVIMRELGSMLREALGKLSEIEAESVKTSVILPVEVIEREDRIRARYNPSNMRSIKLTLVKSLDKIMEMLSGRPVGEESSSMLLFDFKRGDVSIRSAPVFIFGRYRKLERGISQSRRKCTECKGKGCERCGWRGKVALRSVEGILGEVMREFFLADDYVLHGAGREDVDARMLGSGRPFVMEMINPKRRHVNLSEVEREINRRTHGMVEVLGLRFSSRDELRALKESSPRIRKLYRALVEVEGEVSEEDLRKLKEELEGTTVRQKTPARVLWRRSDIVRLKKIYEINFKKINDRKFELYVLCDGGLYVKELISGDLGRTSPSVTELLGKKSFCSELDVLEVMISLNDKVMVYG